MSILDEIIGSTYEYIEKMPKEQRKQYGQFFTSKLVSWQNYLIFPKIQMNCLSSILEQAQVCFLPL